MSEEKEEFTGTVLPGIEELNKNCAVCKDTKLVMFGMIDRMGPFFTNMYPVSHDYLARCPICKLIYGFSPYELQEIQGWSAQQIEGWGYWSNSAGRYKFKHRTKKEISNGVF